jgi:hypothetical protein
LREPELELAAERRHLPLHLPRHLPLRLPRHLLPRRPLRHSLQPNGDGDAHDDAVRSTSSWTR